MRFQVPQFIEVESKIFGPLTLKQFIYLIGGGGMIFLLYVLLPFWLTLLLGLPIGLFVAALAFYKVNNQPFIKIIESAFRYFFSNKLFLWKKEQKKRKSVSGEDKESDKTSEIYVPKFTKSKLKDLAWSLDIREKIKE